MYQALVPCRAQEVQAEALSPAMIIEPSGAKGVLLQLNSPSKDVHADILGFILHGLTMFSVISACFNRWHHRDIRKLGWSMQSMVMKWFLNVLIARSAAFFLWLCGGTN